MLNINSWLQNRIRAGLVKNTKLRLPSESIKDVLDTIEFAHGPEARENVAEELASQLSGIANGYIDGTNEEKLGKYEQYFRDPQYRDSLQKNLPSSFQRKLLDDEVAHSWLRISETLTNISKSELEKSIKYSDFKRISSKHDQDADLVVSHKKHLEQFPAPESYKKIFTDPAKSKSVGRKLSNGISAKMIHDVTGYTHPTEGWQKHEKPEKIMAKPYHKKIESATRSWVKHPITGWATMATKALFNAGGIGHLAEDVSVHEHKGIPMTVHKFAEDHKTVSDVPGRGNGLEASIDPMHVQQIGVMDFLANNLDRHTHNIMIDQNTDKRGYNPLLAIDHERSFQYNRNLNNQYKADESRTANPHRSDSPLVHMEEKGMGFLPHHFDGYHELSDWWKDKGPAIRDEFMKQAEMIKDPGVRQHVMTNFLDRHRKLSQWAAEPGDLFDKQSLGQVLARAQPMQKQRLTSKSLSRLLPKSDPVGGLGTVADVINTRDKLRPNQWRAIDDTVKNSISQMTPAQLAEALSNVHQNPKFNTKKMQAAGFNFRNAILDHVIQPEGWAGNQAVYKKNHLQAVTDAIDAMPADQKETLQYWSDRFKGILHPEQEAA
jgi:hypothetical protein